MLKTIQPAPQQHTANTALNMSVTWLKWQIYHTHEHGVGGGVKLKYKMRSGDDNSDAQQTNFMQQASSWEPALPQLAIPQFLKEAENSLPSSQKPATCS
jgi:hypothetical protein